MLEHIQAATNTRKETRSSTRPRSFRSQQVLCCARPPEGTAAPSEPSRPLEKHFVDPAWKFLKSSAGLPAGFRNTTYRTNRCRFQLSSFYGNSTHDYWPSHMRLQPQGSLDLRLHAGSKRVSLLQTAVEHMGFPGKLKCPICMDQCHSHLVFEV